MTQLDFRFSRCKGSLYDSTTSGVLASGSRQYERFDPYAIASLIPCNGAMIQLDGVTSNRKFTYQGCVGVDLILRAPYEELTPALSGYGDGVLFGDGYKWRFRYKNSVTGECSGLSALPAIGYNVGTLVMDGSGDWVGQKADFYIPDSVIPDYADTVQVFRNTSQGSVYLLLQELVVTGSDLHFTDNFTDDDIAFNEQADLSINPSYVEGIIPPVKKGLKHSTGSLWLYGIERMARYKVGGVTTTADSETIVGSHTYWTPNREGQSIRLYSAIGTAAVTDPTIYRILEVVNYNTIRVYPKVPTSSGGVIQYEIIDDRDGRNIYPSEPGTPNQWDFSKIMAIGIDADETLYHVCQYAGYTWGFTNKRIYQILDDVSLDSSLTYRAVVSLEEGCVGFQSVCTTPYGIVYVTPFNGVKIFDGNASTPLGQDNPLDRFLLKRQFTDPGTNITYASYSNAYQGYEPSLLDQTAVHFDRTNGVVHVFYVPFLHTALCEEVAYSVVHNNWRGPWRVRCTASGYLRNDSGQEQQVFADDFSNIMLYDKGSKDVLNGDLIAPGTYSSRSNFILTCSASTFDYYSDQRVRGSPFLMGTGLDAVTTYIIDVLSNTQVVLETLNTPIATITTNMYLGYVSWYVRTAWIDGGEPIQPKELKSLKLRNQYVSSSDPTEWFSITAIPDGSGAATFPEETITYSSLIARSWYEAKMEMDGTSFVVIFQGYSKRTAPTIYNVVLDLYTKSGRPSAS